MKKFVASAIAAAFVSSSAVAAEDQIYTSQPGPAIHDWSGGYVGVDLGLGTAGGNPSYDCSNWHTCPYGAPLFPVPGNTFPDDEELDDGGFLGGATLGFNGQFSHYVIGVEGDISWADWDSTGSSSDVFGGGALPGNGLGTTTTSRSMDWFATLRGRAGVVIHDALIFVTAGAAIADVGLTTSVTNGPDPLNINPAPFLWSCSASETMIGVTAGGGIELPLTDKVSLKGEVLYYDLGNITATARDRIGTEATTYDATMDVSGVVARIGVNLHF